MPADRKTFEVISFGCKVNQAEGQALAARLREFGFVEADARARIAIVNTCAVTAEAARQGRQRVRRAVRDGAAVIVTGCAAHPAAGAGALGRLDGVGLIEADKDRVVDFVRRDDGLAARLAPRAAQPRRLTRDLAPSAARSRAMLKVQDGCPDACAYCIVPLVRPVIRSTPPEEAVRQLEALVAEGYREVMICGIHLGLYGADLAPRTRLADLLEHMLTVPDLGRLRLSSIAPLEISDRLLALLRSEPERLCPHLHVSLQSGDDGVLARMGRPYTTSEFAGVVRRIREALPMPAVTTDVLVGFPGETDAAFENTLRTCREVSFSRIHAFPFSPRPGTRAAAMPDPVPHETVRARRRAVSALGDALAAAYRKSLVGRAARVVLETLHPDGSAEGLSERYVRVHVRAPLPAGAGRREMLPVRLLSTADGILEAKAD
ncbi:MAG TPA: tRNA (N(6)-L-threonylcarbamoyladenosine(37)-C(2))-methylthiotransferase MtaB [Phycisphaerae bacterium]|nr:tRNA (N(6)-L-threonylcarbamoyladenosine(37)-C(2))-methylthiotransferase MtaB [Phycisphaerae bacterium]